MYRILILLTVLIAISAQQKQQGQAINVSGLVNYTFYHHHLYPQRKSYGVSFSLKHKCNQVEECQSKLNQSFIEMKQIFQFRQLNLYLTGKSESYDKEVEVEWSMQIKAGQNEESFGFVLDQLAELTQNNNTFIWQIFRYRELQIDNEIQKNKAREDVLIKSNFICENYLNSQFKQLSYFEEEVNNSSKKQVNLIGEYVEIAEQLEEYKYDIDDTYFKCQIICQKKHQISLQQIQNIVNINNNQNKRPQKSHKKGNKKKNKKIDLSKYQ